MRRIYSFVVWEPDDFDSNWTVVYHCSHTIHQMANESVWIVPGTLELNHD